MKTFESVYCQGGTTLAESEAEFRAVRARNLKLLEQEAEEWSSAGGESSDRGKRREQKQAEREDRREKRRAHKRSLRDESDVQTKNARAESWTVPGKIDSHSRAMRWVSAIWLVLTPREICPRQFLAISLPR